MKRENPWLFERDGDLNPTWLLVVIFAAVGIGMSILAGVVALRQPDKAWPAVVASLLFLLMSIVAFLIGAYPIAKAKVLAQSEVLKAGAAAMGGFGGKDVPVDYETMQDRADD